MTAENFTINSDLINNPNRIATATDVVNGIDNNDVVEALITLKGTRLCLDKVIPAAL